MRPQRSASFTTLVAVLALSLAASAAYTVRPGDTLSGIATRFGVSIGDLARANAITDPNRVFAGRTLRLPGGAPSVQTAATERLHLVVAGDNLSDLARRYGTTVGALAKVNGLDRRRHLLIGTRLRLPAGGGGVAATVSGSGFPLRLRRSPARLALVPHFERWAAANGIPADLLMATTWLESGWQNHVTSHVGAIGIGQLMPDTVEFVRDHLIGVRSLDPRVPEHNIRMSARYLRWLLARADGDARLALAGYYQGPASVRANGPYRGTVAYVDGVLSLRHRFRG